MYMYTLVFKAVSVAHQSSHDITQNVGPREEISRCASIKHIFISNKPKFEKKFLS